MEKFAYKGCAVEIFTTEKGGGWVWAFVIDDAWAEASKGEKIESRQGAIEVAKERAYAVVDRER